MGLKTSSKTTITDIAKDCKLSIATVSRVLNNPNYPVSFKAKRAVFESAKKLHYNSKYQNLKKSNENKSIGIIVSSLQNTFFVQLINGACQQALTMGFTPYIFCSQRSIKNERHAIQTFSNSNIQGLLIESIDDSVTSIKRFINRGGRICLLGSNSNISIKDTIIAEADTISGGAMAINYLISRGHRKIALISAPLSKKSRRDTLTGCLKAIEASGIRFDNNRDIYIADHEEELKSRLYENVTGQELATKVLSSGREYSAVLAMNDLLAIGAMQTFLANKLSIPNDISVMGIDDIPSASTVYPPLTTVYMPSESLGRTACQLLINSMTSIHNECKLALSVQPTVVERESVKNLKAK